MATIYRFIVQESTKSGGGGRKSTTKSRKSTGKGKWVNLLGSEKGGVEHNRKLRAINPLINKMTGGYWEAGLRVGRAGLGLFKRNTATNKVMLSMPAVAILIAFAIQTILKIQNWQAQIAQKQNTQDYKRLQNGQSAIHSSYKVTTDWWTGRRTYNENK